MLLRAAYLLTLLTGLLAICAIAGAVFDLATPSQMQLLLSAAIAAGTLGLIPIMLGLLLTTLYPR